MGKWFRNYFTSKCRITNKDTNFIRSSKYVLSWKCKMVEPIWKTVNALFFKSSISLQYDPVFIPLPIYQNEIRFMSIPIFTAALFICHDWRDESLYGYNIVSWVIWEELKITLNIGRIHKVQVLGSFFWGGSDSISILLLICIGFLCHPDSISINPLCLEISTFV